MTRGRRRPGMSLEYKLPLLITALLVAMMATGMLFAYTQVKRAAIENVRTRLQLLAQDLSNLLAPGAPLRMQVMREVASNPSLVEHLALRTTEGESAVREVLESLRVPNQPDARIFLFDLDGEVVLHLDPERSESADASLPREHLPDAGFGPLFQMGARVYYWITTPVVREGRAIGVIAELRRVGGAGDTSPVEALIGQDAEVFFGNASGAAPWVSLNGEPVAPPSIAPFTGSVDYEAADGSVYFVHSEAISALPWHVITRSPTSVALARPNAFLRQAALVGLVLSLLGAVGAWILSRGITQPLKALRRASESLAQGDYRRRVNLDRSDEMGILADAYNHMADRVQTAHEELTRQYETANELARDLDRASRAKSDFLATMSHEIRTPINAIIGYTDLLLLGVDGQLNPAQASQLERVRASGRHLVNLVDQVLDLARVESGRLSVSIRTATAASSVETMLTMSRPLAREKGVEIVEECAASDELWYRGDPQRVDQILVNLLSNAVKFTDPGGRVFVSCSGREDRLPADGEPGRWTCFTIEDTGLGIMKDDLESIFEPFVQVESGYTRRHGGAGLGLAISLRLARSMGGDLTVTSTIGKGSSFTLWLPAASAESLEDVAPPVAVLHDGRSAILPESRSL